MTLTLKVGKKSLQQIADNIRKGLDDSLTIAYMSGSASRLDELRAKDAEIEAMRKQCSADGFVSVEDFKVKLPERHWHHDVGHFYDSEEVIAALKSANVEI